MKTTTEKHSKLMIPPTDDVYGFYGTILQDEARDCTKAAKAWKSAMDVLCEKRTDGNGVLARNFLRSRFGRHFADATTWHRNIPMRARLKRVVKNKWVRQAISDIARGGGELELYAGDPAA